MASRDLPHSGGWNHSTSLLYNCDRDRLREQLNELAYQTSKGIPAPDGSITLGGYLDQWLAEVAAKQVRPSTYTGYETNIRLHIKPLIGTKKLAKLTTPGCAEDDRDTAIQTPVTGYRHHVGSSSAIRACNPPRRTGAGLPRGTDSRNIAKLVQTNAQDAAQHDPYSADESKRLLIQAQRHRLHALWVLLVMLGVRRGEVLALRFTKWM